MLCLRQKFVLEIKVKIRVFLACFDLKSGFTFLLDVLRVPITSSRDGLDRSNAYVEEFIEVLAKIRSKFTELWTRLRQKEVVIKLPNFIRDNESYKNWLDGLNSEQKEMNKKLLALLVNKSFADHG